MTQQKTEVILGSQVREGDFLLYTIHATNGTRQGHWNVKVEKHDGHLGWWREKGVWGGYEQRSFRPFNTVEQFATTKLEVRSPRPETDNEWGAISP